MQRMPYFLMAGLLIATLAFGIVGGGAFWLVPAIIWPIIFVYFLFDRRLKANEDDEEDELVHSAEGGASGAQ